MSSPTTAEPTADTEAAAVRAVDLTKVYGTGDMQVTALAGVSIDFPSGQFTAIMGPSGSGKSTLMHCLAGLDSITAGQVLLGDVDIASLNDKNLTALRRDRVGFIFQQFNLLPTMTAQENITLPLDIAGTKVDQEWFDQVVDAVNLRTGCVTGPPSCPAASSSGWRAPGPCVTRPAVVFADEPTGNLDSTRERRGARVPAAIGPRTRSDHRHGHPRPLGRRATPTASCSSPTAGSSTRCSSPTADRVLDRMKSLDSRTTRSTAAADAARHAS